VAFIEGELRDPDTGAPFKLYGAEKRFLRRALKLTKAGRLPYPELVYSAPKKSGKTALAAMITIYVIAVLGGRFAEAYCVANDLEQAQGQPDPRKGMPQLTKEQEKAIASEELTIDAQ